MMSVIPRPNSPDDHDGFRNASKLPAKLKPVAPSAGPKGPTIKMKMRGDLTFDTQAYQGVEFCVVKEPLGQKYFQFPPHVFFLLEKLDGFITIDELQDAYHEKFAPKRINRSELQQLLQRFHRDGLVTSDLPGQGVELLKRGRKNVAMENVQKLSNVLAVRYRGFDPELILNWLNKYTWWIFTSTCAWFVAFFATVALFSVLVNFAEFQSRLPGFQAFFDPNHWFMFACVLGVTKMCHEFGHGLSCKRLGGECHEIGFMLLVLTPCLYCNVSDSWRLPNKWHRAAIGAAGMYVEVILATIATFIWWFVQPGWIQDVCLQVMLVSSISTVLFNGNPLLRFDGYYIMSDLLEIPNLQQKSTKALTTLLGRHWLGMEMPDDHLMPANRPLAFAMFTVAAFCYRWLIMFSIIWFLTTWLKPYGLESVGVGIAVFSAVGMLVWPLYRLYKYMSVPGRMNQVKKGRFTIISLVALGILGLVLFIPLPHSMRCTVVVVPEKIEAIYIEESGILENCEVKPGMLVEKNQTLAVLSNLDLELKLAEAKGRLDQKRAERVKAAVNGSIEARDERSIRLRREAWDLDATLAVEIDQAKKELVELARQAQRLEIKSPIRGTVIETPAQSQTTPQNQLEPLLSGRNTSAIATRGQRFCEVADMSKWYGVVLLTEDQVAFVKKGHAADVRLFTNASQVIETKIEVAPVPSDKSIDRQDYSLTFEQNDRSKLPDLVAEMIAVHALPNSQYYARVPLQGDDLQLKIGLQGRAKLKTGKLSLGARAWWWINKHFRS